MTMRRGHQDWISGLATLALSATLAACSSQDVGTAHNGGAMGSGGSSGAGGAQGGKSGIGGEPSGSGGIGSGGLPSGGGGAGLGGQTNGGASAGRGGQSGGGATAGAGDHGSGGDAGGGASGAGGTSAGGRGGFGGRASGGGGGRGSGMGGAGGRACSSSDARCPNSVWCGTVCCPYAEWCDTAVEPPVCKCGGSPSCTGGNSCNSVSAMQGGCGQLCCNPSTPMGCPVSRRAAKRDIQQVGAGELQALYDQLRAIQLATYTYKVEPVEATRRLGFIIDDTHAPAAINPDGNSVDLYGYLSMAVAAVQIQARDIEALRARIRVLEEEAKAPARKPTAPRRR